MKTLPLLVCICAFSVCFKVSEGQRRGWNLVYPRRIIVPRRVVVVRRPLLHPQFVPVVRPLFRPQFRPVGRPLFHPQFRPVRRQVYHIHHHKYYTNYRIQKHYWPRNCLDKNSTVVKNNTSGAPTQVPLTSNSVKSVPFPDEKPTQIYITTFDEENTGTPDSSTMTLSQQPLNTPTPQTETTVSPAVEQTTLSPTQNALLQFLQYVDNLLQYLSDLAKSP